MPAPSTRRADCFGTEEAYESPILPDRRTQHGLDMEARDVRRYQLLESRSSESMVNPNGAMSTRLRSKISKPVRGLERKDRIGMLPTGCAHVDQFNGSSLLSQQPDACAFHLQQAAAGLRNGAKDTRNVAAVERLTFRQFAECVLILLKQRCCILLE